MTAPYSLRLARRALRVALTHLAEAERAATSGSFLRHDIGTIRPRVRALAVAVAEYLPDAERDLTERRRRARQST